MKQKNPNVSLHLSNVLVIRILLKTSTFQSIIIFYIYNLPVSRYNWDSYLHFVNDNNENRKG